MKIAVEVIGWAGAALLLGAYALLSAAVSRRSLRLQIARGARSVAELRKRLQERAGSEPTATCYKVRNWSRPPVGANSHRSFNIGTVTPWARLATGNPRTPAKIEGYE